MPTYEYACQACGKHFEAWQKISDDPIEICPTCGGHVRRVLYPVGLVFKGGGFYSTDSRGSGANASEASSASTTSESSTAGESKTESKPASETAPSKAAAGE
jgi:putative FmdB family regulatory protein